MLNHPSIAAIYGVHHGDPGWYLALELVRVRTSRRDSPETHGSHIVFDRLQQSSDIVLIELDADPSRGG